MDAAFVFKPTEEQIVRLKIHHGGMFIYKSSTVYVNSEIVEEEWGWDVDTMSYIDLRKVIKSIGYKAFKCLWYKHPQKALCRGLKQLNEGVFEKSKKKLNDFKGDEVVVIDGVEAEPVVEGEVQLDEEGFVEVEVQGEDEAGVVGEMEVVVEGVDVDDVGGEADDDDVRAEETDDDDVGADEDDNDSNDCSEVSDNGIQEGFWAFISDQQKGLVEIIKELGEDEEHRLCVKHLYGNWKKKYPGAHMKKLMWMAAQATITPDWEKAMVQIKSYDVEA
ncbi:hypothetical protein GmHk_20G056827 [Glycine max]|nr:hypothetical protein GmHk_20G056827 [Glycine max]